MKSRIAWSILLSAIVLGEGCSSNKVAEGVANANNTNIKRVANFFAGYAMQNASVGPKSEEDLKRWVHDVVPADKLQMVGVDPQNVATTFTSERDHKPFKIRWGVYVPTTSAVPIVFEAEGIEGKKQVADSNAQVQEVDDAEYKRLWGEKPSAAVPAGPPNSGKSSGDAAKQPDKK